MVIMIKSNNARVCQPVSTLCLERQMMVTLSKIYALTSNLEGKP